MKTSIRSTVLTSIAILVLLGGTTAAFASTSQTYQLAIPNGQGYVTNLGTQTYTVNGGTNYGGYVDGVALNPGGTLQYSLYAVQYGLSTQGWGNIRLSGTTSDGSPVSVSGTFNIDSSVAAGVVGNSELPIYLVSSAPNIQITVGGTTTTLSSPLLIETPYWDPWGGPLTIASADGASLVLAATYNSGTILWSGSQVTGPVYNLGTSAAISSSPGTLSLTTVELENLVSGTASDAGTITLSGMTPSTLNGQGFYSGTSSIPMTNPPPTSCDQIFGTIPGTCYFTGFFSQGTFRAGDVSGSYTTTWGEPATYFSSAITATVSQQQPQAHTANAATASSHGFFGLGGLFGLLGSL